MAGFRSAAPAGAGGARQLALRPIVKTEVGRARTTSRALGSMAHGCDRSSVAFTTVPRTASIKQRRLVAGAQ
jgi:hypothetical protein